MCCRLLAAVAQSPGVVFEFRLGCMRPNFILYFAAKLRELAGVISPVLFYARKKKPCSVICPKALSVTLIEIQMIIKTNKIVVIVHRYWVGVDAK
jgi:hypothetical protein